MEYDIDIGERVHDRVLIANVTEHDLDVVLLLRLVQPAPRARRAVTHERARLRAKLDETLGQMAADESTGASYENFLVAPVHRLLKRFSRKAAKEDAKAQRRI